MLPGLVLTLGLVAQSIGALVSPAARNPDVPRFVNIGDEIIESATAKPIAPAGVCAPVPDVSAAAPPARVVVEVHVRDDESDVAVPDAPEDASIDQTAGQILGGVTFVPVFVRRPPHGRFAHRAPFASRSEFRVPGAPSAQTVMLPPFQTVLLPPFPTVLLPPGSMPPRAR